MAQPKPPPPGISAIGGDGSRQPVPTAPGPSSVDKGDTTVPLSQRRDAGAKKTAHNQNAVNQARRAGGKDRLSILDSANARRIQTASTIPVGTGRVSREVIEVDLAPNAQRGWATFTSIDGETYRIRTRDASGKVHPFNATHCLYWCLRELRLGGDYLSIMEAFKVKLQDADGKQGFPFVGVDVPSMNGPLREANEISAEEAFEQGFSVGVDDED